MTKVVVITGASRGIGAATAQLAGRNGYTVCANYLENKDAADRIVEAIKCDGGQAIQIKANIADETQVIELFDAVINTYGHLDALVNNAGILEQQMRLDQMTNDRFKRIFSTNITGAFLCAREAVRRMSTKHGGSGGAIVNVSSIAARLGAPGEYIDYAASKGAIDTLTIGLAKEVAEEGIRVNAVRPGIIETDIHASGGDPGRPDRLKGIIPMRRPGQAEEVAQAILWLLSDEASYSTGTFIDVGGGR